MISSLEAGKLKKKNNQPKLQYWQIQKLSNNYEHHQLKASSVELPDNKILSHNNGRTNW